MRPFTVRCKCHKPYIDVFFLFLKDCPTTSSASASFRLAHYQILNLLFKSVGFIFQNTLEGASQYRWTTTQSIHQLTQDVLQWRSQSPNHFHMLIVGIPQYKVQMEIQNSQICTKKHVNRNQMKFGSIWVLPLHKIILFSSSGILIMQ